MAAPSLLPPEAIAPWLPELSQRRQDAVTQHLGLLSGAPPDELVRKIFGDVILSLTSRIAESIFAPERIQHLVRQLKAYRNQQFATGDKSLAGYAMGAIASLEGEDQPAQNRFLLALR